MDIGYYGLGFYWHPFEIDTDHNFKNGTKFSDAVALYYLDMDLRNLLLKSLNRIEVNFKTAMVYEVSNTHQDSPTWFIDPRVVNQHFINTIHEFYTTKFIKHNKVIKKHHDNYLNDKYAPAWKTIEFFTFGTVLKIYSALKDENLKKKIIERYGIINVNKFENHMTSLLFVRNVCAHGGVLFDLKLPKGVSLVPGLTVKDHDRHSFNTFMELLIFYLGKISINRAEELRTKYSELMLNHKRNDVIHEILKTKTGFLIKT